MYNTHILQLFVFLEIFVDETFDNLSFKHLSNLSEAYYFLHRKIRQVADLCSLI